MNGPRRLASVAIVLLVAACATERPVTAPDGTAADSTLERQILLTVQQTDAFAAGLTGAPGSRYQLRRYGPTPAVERVLSQLVRQHGLRRVDGWAIRSLGVYCEVLEVATDAAVDEVIAALNADSRVDLAQRMNVFTTKAAGYDDPYAELQSAAIEMEVARAHRVATGRGVLVAIVDSAIEANHPDLLGRVRYRRDLVGQWPRPEAEVHGTAVAGVIASAVNNHQGIIGVAPDVGIAALRACAAVTEGSVAARCSTFSLALALETALAMDADIINLSLGGPADPLLSRLLDAVIARGVIVIAAQPEDAAADETFPASHPRVIAVESSASGGHDSQFRLGAPAAEILTTTPGAAYSFLSGNSLAAAHASGAVALLLESEPSISVERAAAVLAATSSRTPGHSSINACRALERLRDTAFCDP